MNRQIQRKNSSRYRRSSSQGKSQSWHFETSPHVNGGLVNAVESVKDRVKKKLWVGVLGIGTDNMDKYLRSDIETKMHAEKDSQPVWMPDAEFESCYDEFCHQVGQIFLVHIQSLIMNRCYGQHYTRPYQMPPKQKCSSNLHLSNNTRLSTNALPMPSLPTIKKAISVRICIFRVSFAQCILSVWVNDYHLMLLPAMLREAPGLPSHVPIGFFMHVAFPSSEIFRCLAVREHLLRGPLGADLVGFQTVNFSRHYRQTVSRILALESLPKGIQVEAGGRGRFVDVGVFPMGIDVISLREKRYIEYMGLLNSLLMLFQGQSRSRRMDKITQTKICRNEDHCGS